MSKTNRRSRKNWSVILSTRNNTVASLCKILSGNLVFSWRPSPSYSFVRTRMILVVILLTFPRKIVWEVMFGINILSSIKMVGLSGVPCYIISLIVIWEDRVWNKGTFRWVNWHPSKERWKEMTLSFKSKKCKVYSKIYSIRQEKSRVLMNTKRLNNVIWTVWCNNWGYHVYSRHLAKLTNTGTT